MARPISGPTIGGLLRSAARWARWVVWGTASWCIGVTLAAAAPNTPPPASQVIHLRLAQTDPDNPLIAYRIEVIRLAMQASGKRYTLGPCATPVTPTSDLRYIELIRQGDGCNLFATSVGSRMTRGLLPIAFPIYLGGGGYRVLIANQRGIAQAPLITSLEDLKKHTIGTGDDWVDTDILTSNGFDVVRGSYLNLFEMLKAGRFDYFNRSLFEASGEIGRYSPKGELAVVPNLLIVYQEDLFFYTSPDRRDIHDSLLDGLRIIYRNGKLAELIDRHESTREVRKSLLSTSLRVFRLRNEQLTEAERKTLETYSLKWLR